MNLKEFLIESNRIEGIDEPPTEEQVDWAEVFIRRPEIVVNDMVGIVEGFQPGAVLRDKPGLNVRVGKHYPPQGGPDIRLTLESLLANRTHPYLLHHAYESLHPFTDGNGRSGRLLWLWGMGREDGSRKAAMQLGFLHRWYYQSLQFGVQPR